jgi:hypothetical protein
MNPGTKNYFCIVFEGWFKSFPIEIQESVCAAFEKLLFKIIPS